VLLASILALSLFGLTRLRFQTGTEPFFDRSQPEEVIHQRVNKQFGSDDTVFVTCEAGDLFRHDVLTALRQLVVSIEGFSVRHGDEDSYPIHDIQGLTTVKDLVGSDQSFRTVRLVPDPIPTDPDTLQLIRDRAVKNEVIRSNFLSNDLRTTVIAARLVTNVNDDDMAATVVHVRNELARTNDALPSMHCEAIGSAIIRADTASFMAQDLSLFIPAMFVLILVSLFFLVRRFTGIVVATVNVTLCLFAAMATLALSGGTINNLSTILPVVAMVLSLTVIIHFMAELAKNTLAVGAAASPHQTISELLMPSFMCSLTTAVGFGSLATSSIPALHDFGVVAGVSTLMTLVISFTVVAVAVHYWKPSTLVAENSPANSETFGNWIDAYTRLVFRRPRSLLTISVSLFVVGTAGLAFLVADMDTIGQFPEHSAPRVATRFVEAKDGGADLMIVSVQHPDRDAFLQPENLVRLDEAADFLRRELGATHVLSITDFVRLMNKAFMDEDPREFRIPDQREQVAQLMLLNGDDTTDQYINQSYSWVRLVARVPVQTSKRRAQDYVRLDDYLRRQFPRDRQFVADATGDSRLWTVITDQIVGSQIRSFSFSLFFVFLPIFVLFRSWSAGLFSLPSNIFPIGITLGLMGWLSINLDVATANIASVVLGIVVDDTIHFIQYMRMRLAAHGDHDRALTETLRTKGVGVSWVTLILAMGFGTTLLSSFAPTRHFGVLTCVALFAGAVGELTLLPPLFVLIRSRLGVRHKAGTK